MNAIVRYLSARGNALLGRNELEKVSEAVAAALQGALQQHGTIGSVMVINHLTVNVQLNSANGGGATINVGGGK